MKYGAKKRLDSVKALKNKASTDCMQDTYISIYSIQSFKKIKVCIFNRLKASLAQVHNYALKSTINAYICV